jgi:hypothetical protein
MATEVLMSPETREKIRARALERYADPGARQKISDGAKRRFDRPEERERLRQARLRQWADPTSAYRTRETRGEHAGNWQGGIIRKAGRVWVYAPDHPRVRNQRRPYVLRAWLVLERKMGRFLLPTEHVHHINGVKDDDRPENLVALSSSTHSTVHHADGRMIGSRNPSAKLTEDQVIEIRRRYVNREITYERASQEYGVSNSCVWQVLTHRKWTHLPSCAELRQ